MNNLHQHAKNTFHSRMLMVQRVREQGKSVLEVAEGLGGCSRTVYKWLANYRQGRQAVLHNCCSLPLRSPQRMAVERVSTVADMRLMRMSGPSVAFSLSSPIFTVNFEIRRMGLRCLPRLEPQVPVIRYEPENHGGIVYLDIKKLDRIDGVSHRIIGDYSWLGLKAGCELLHICVDDNRRVAYTEMIQDESAASAACFLIRSVRWFKRHSLKVERVLADNGACYRSEPFGVFCLYLAVWPYKNKPHTPRTSVNAERFIHTSLKEWAYTQPYESSAQREKHLAPWINYYTNQRPNSALKRKPSVSKLLKCEGRSC